MRISKIEVKGLFDTFDHVIPLNLAERITIIHGLNGLGKTTLLRMVRNLFAGRFEALSSVLFKSLNVELDDGSSIKVDRDKQQDVLHAAYPDYSGLTVTKSRIGVPDQSFKPTVNQNRADYLRIIARSSSNGLIQLHEDLWLFEPTGEELTLDEVMVRFDHLAPGNTGSITKKKDVPLWFDEVKRINVKLIETQRLLRPVAINSRLQGYTQNTSVIRYHSQDLFERMSVQLGEYASLSQSLDRSFPKRLLTHQEEHHANVSAWTMSQEELRNRFAKLDQKRKQLEDVGLLSRDEEGFAVPDRMEDATRGVLTIYLNDTEKTPKTREFGGPARTIQRYS